MLRDQLLGSLVDRRGPLEQIPRGNLGLDSNLIERSHFSDLTREVLAGASLGEVVQTIPLGQGYVLYFRKRDEADFAIGVYHTSNSNHTIATFCFSYKDGVFQLYNRRVSPRYRGAQNETGERLSNLMMEALATHVQDVANEAKETRTVALDAAQLNVWAWLVDNDFTVDARHKERWDAVLAGDERLYVGTNWYVGSFKDIPSLGISGVEPEHLSGSHAVRLGFERSFHPVN